MVVSLSFYECKKKNAGIFLYSTHRVLYKVENISSVVPPYEKMRQRNKTLKGLLCALSVKMNRAKFHSLSPSGNEQVISQKMSSVSIINCDHFHPLYWGVEAHELGTKAQRHSKQVKTRISCLWVLCSCAWTLKGLRFVFS